MSSDAFINYHQEIERTFVVLGKNAEKIQSILKSQSTIKTKNGTEYHLSKIKKATAVHFFSKSNQSNIKLRLKFILKNDKIKVRYSPKIELGEHVFEGRWLKDISLDKAFFKIQGFGPIVSSFVKRKIKHKYLSKNARSINVCIDNVIGFDPCSVNYFGSSFYHLEIEAEHTDDLQEFCDCHFFCEQIRPCVRPILEDDTKWVQASTYCRQNAYLNYDSVAEMRKYIVSIKQIVLS